MHLPDGGTRQMVDRIAARLGERFRPGANVAGIGRGDDGTWRLESDEPVVALHIVDPAAFHQAASLLGGELAELLAALRAAPVAVVSLGGRGRPSSTGVRVPGDARGRQGRCRLPVRALRTPRNGRRRDTGWPR